MSFREWLKSQQEKGDLYVTQEMEQEEFEACLEMAWDASKAEISRLNRDDHEEFEVR